VGQLGAEVLGVDVRDMEGREVAQVSGGRRVCLRVHFRAIEALARPIVGFYLNDHLGQNLFGENTAAVEGTPAMEAGAERVACFTFDMPVLRAGPYTVTVAVAEGTMASHTRHHWIHEACALTADGTGSGGTGLVGIPMRAVEFRAVGKEGSAA
jgi:lipopolysaccharide transport system ATP-binding protein